MFVDLPSGATGLTGAIALGQNRAAGIQLPTVWLAANLTFQVSYDGVTYANLYDSTGTEYTVTCPVLAAGRVILLPMVDFLGIPFLKIRSGTSAAPVDQTTNRSLILQLV